MSYQFNTRPNEKIESQAKNTINNVNHYLKQLHTDHWYLVASVPK